MSYKANKAGTSWYSHLFFLNIFKTQAFIIFDKKVILKRMQKILGVVLAFPLLSVALEVTTRGIIHMYEYIFFFYEHQICIRQNLVHLILGT